MTAVDAIPADTASDATAGGSGARSPRRGRRVPVRFYVFGVLVLVAAGLLGWLLSWQSPIPVRQVTVVGTQPEREAAILAAADVDTGTPIRDLDVAGIVQRVQALPGIETAELAISRPWTIVVQVDERFPFALVAHQPGDPWTVIDGTGTAIRRSAEKPPRLPVVEPADQPGPALAALSALPEQLRQSVRKATVDTAGAVTLTLQQGTVVRWGRPGEDAAKAQAVSVLLQYKPAGINVSVPQRPALSGELTLPKRNQPRPEDTSVL